MLVEKAQVQKLSEFTVNVNLVRSKLILHCPDSETTDERRAQDPRGEFAKEKKKCGLYKVEGSTGSHREPVVLFNSMDSVAVELFNCDELCYASHILTDHVSVELSPFCRTPAGGIMPYRGLFLARCSDAEAVTYANLFELEPEQKQAAIREYLVDNPQRPTKCPCCEKRGTYLEVKRHVFAGSGANTSKGRIVKKFNCHINDNYQRFWDFFGLRFYLPENEHLRGELCQDKYVRD